MCPEQQVYLDHRQARRADEPVPVGCGAAPLEDVYRLRAACPRRSARTGGGAPVGAQANLWTEFMDNAREVDYQAFPRLAAFAEVAWSALPRQPADRDCGGLLGADATHLARLDALGVEYRPRAGPQALAAASRGVGPTDGGASPGGVNVL